MCLVTYICTSEIVDNGEAPSEYYINQNWLSISGIQYDTQRKVYDNSNVLFTKCSPSDHL